MNVKNTILLLTMASLTACSENIENEQASIPTNNGVADDLVPVEFSVSGMRNVDFTRATSSIVSFDVNEKVKVWVKPAGATDYSGYDYTTATSGQYNVPLTAPTLPPYYPPGASTSVEAYAYYPSTAGETFTVQDDQTLDADYKASDLMYAVNRTVTKDGSNGNDCLTLEHQMAQLVITAQAQTGSSLKISAVEVEAFRSITFNPTPSATDRVSSPDNKGTITALKKTAGTGFAAGTGYIVIPPQVINGVIIRIKTGSGTPDETATYAFTGTTGSFQSGATYNLNLTVSPDQLGLASSISNWNGLGSVNVTPSGNLTVSPITAQEYTGQALTPAFTVYRDGAFFSPNNYDVRWVNNVESGVAYIIVTGKNTGTADYSTCVGLTSFIITKAYGKINYPETSVTKTYGNEPFTNPLSNFDIRDGDVSGGRKADGPVTYASSKPEVATVNETTGEVTILKAGTTTITATATSGANYVYDTAEGNHTSSYELTVNEAAGSISFGYSNREQTWSSTESNNKFTQAVTKTGDGTVTYSVPAVNTANNTCGATIDDASTGEVKFTKSGSVVVTATVSDTEHYKYAVNTASYTLTVNKAQGFVTITPTEGTVDAGFSIQFNIVTNHGGSLTVADVSGNNRATPTISGTVVNVSTTSGVGSSATIRVTCDATDCYNASTVDYALTINSNVDIKKNPLWWVAEGNFTHNNTIDTRATYEQGTLFSWTSAMSKWGITASSSSYDGWAAAGKKIGNVYYHLPTKLEYQSIVPWKNDVQDYQIFSNLPASGQVLTEEPCTFGYSNSTKYSNGTDNSGNSGIAYKSYWSSSIQSGTVLTRYAIRFLGTQYCSVWRYRYFRTSLPYYVEICSRLIEKIEPTETTKLSMKLLEIQDQSYSWDENQSIGAIRRVFYSCGYDAQNTIGYSTTRYANERGHYWSTTESDANGAWRLLWFTDASYVVMNIYPNKSLCFSVRLFRDN